MTTESTGDDRTGDVDAAGIGVSDIGGVDEVANLADGANSANGERKADGTFARGHSGNRRGRPKQSRNLVTLFNEKRDELVAIKIDGKAVRKTRMEVMVTNLWNRAMALEPKALAAALAILRATGQIAEPAAGDGDLPPDSAAVLDAFMARAIARKPPGDDRS